MGAYASRARISSTCPRRRYSYIPRIYRPAACIAQLLYTRILKAQASSLQSGDFIKDSFCKSAELELIKRWIVFERGDLNKAYVPYLSAIFSTPLWLRCSRLQCKGPEAWKLVRGSRLYRKKVTFCGVSFYHGWRLARWLCSFHSSFKWHNKHISIGLWQVTWDFDMWLFLSSAEPGRNHARQ